MKNLIAVVFSLLLLAVGGCPLSEIDNTVEAYGGTDDFGPFGTDMGTSEGTDMGTSEETDMGSSDETDMGSSDETDIGPYDDVTHEEITEAMNMLGEFSNVSSFKNIVRELEHRPDWKHKLLILLDNHAAMLIVKSYLMQSPTPVQQTIHEIMRLVLGETPGQEVTDHLTNLYHNETFNKLVKGLMSDQALKDDIKALGDWDPEKNGFGHLANKNLTISDLLAVFQVKFVFSKIESVIKKQSVQELIKFLATDEDFSQILLIIEPQLESKVEALNERMDINILMASLGVTEDVKDFILRALVLMFP